MTKGSTDINRAKNHQDGAPYVRRFPPGSSPLSGKHHQQQQHSSGNSSSGLQHHSSSNHHSHHNSHNHVVQQQQQQQQQQQASQQQQQQQSQPQQSIVSPPSNSNPYNSAFVRDDLFPRATGVVGSGVGAQPTTTTTTLLTTTTTTTIPLPTTPKKKKNKKKKVVVLGSSTNGIATVVDPSMLSHLPNGNGVNGVGTPTGGAIPVTAAAAASLVPQPPSANSTPNLIKKDVFNDTTEWTSRTLFIHNIVQEMDENHIKSFLNTTYPYEFRPSIKPNQLYILFNSPEHAKAVFYSITGKRKIDNGGQSCVKLLFNGEYKTVIRCTNPDPFPLFTTQSHQHLYQNNSLSAFDHTSAFGASDSFNSPLSLSQPSYYDQHHSQHPTLQILNDFNFYLSQPSATALSSPLAASTPPLLYSSSPQTSINGQLGQLFLGDEYTHNPRSGSAIGSMIGGGIGGGGGGGVSPLHQHQHQQHHNSIGSGLPQHHIQHHPHHHHYHHLHQQASNTLQSSNMSPQSVIANNGAPKVHHHNIQQHSMHAEYQNHLRHMKDDQILIYPANSLSTLQRVSTFNFKKFPAVFSHINQSQAPETKATLVTGFIRDSDDRKNNIPAPAGGKNGAQQDHSDSANGNQIFYFWCYEKSTPPLHIISNLNASFLRERCGRLSMLILTDFAPDNSYAIGSVQFFSGSPLDVATITRCILLNHQVFHSENFPRDLDDLYDDWTPPADEEKRRIDLTHLCPVTIDPPSSTDLDDALSFRVLEERHEGKSVFEVGIHISDVSYFLDKNSKLDLEAEFRLNAIYLVGTVIPMLPKNLSSNTCSLKLFQKRFCFSLLIKIRSDGKVIEHTFCKSFLRSLGHMSYEKAQRVINRYKQQFSAIENYQNNQTVEMNIADSSKHLQDILDHVKMNSDWNRNPDFTGCGPELEDRVNQSIWGLYLVSSLLNNIRRDRGEIFDIGSNIQYDLSVDGTPFRVDLLPKLESHVLVQEYMHLANNLAAISLLKSKSEYGILYSPCSLAQKTSETTASNGLAASLHITPSQLDNRKRFFERINIYMHQFTNISILPTDDWKGIKQKVEECIKYCTFEQMQALRRLTIHLMDPTRYITVSDKLQQTSPSMTTVPSISNEDHSHYTHFTAPIRRYMDVNIHRVLSIQLTKEVNWTPDLTIKPYWQSEEHLGAFKAALPVGPQLNSLCQRYNEISWKRKISEKLNTLYLALYLWEHGPITTPAVIIAIPSKHLIIYLVDYNMEVSCDKNDFDSLDDDQDIAVASQLDVFLSVEPFVLFRNGLIPKVKVSKHPPFPS
ncbi:hypothetical protein PPL_08612 [Heterostelium album PN500]|uniref:RNB domain-containing protein n=1 Tax=Heterostelium pallidum (strain ATCC 26659 / Pp 5 / PN500) TaxID=670386 RepID=D3BJ87_HETP5|nr:hypothetical protein PPL_08612 [Heterostelium album PN500]EFA77967.1 hypothetical protein PPL_08612 [Heterostelium album PN500]|eukprot:XP_020430095.1 hypothetical protein PPL_08612 [Heterostelium album PN500]